MMRASDLQRALIITARRTSTPGRYAAGAGRSLELYGPADLKTR